MAKKTTKKRRPQANLKVPTELPPGVKLLHRLVGHKGPVMSLAFDPQGEILASGSADGMVKLWDLGSGEEGKSFFAGPQMR